jgi:hypothetical protein
MTDGEKTICKSRFYIILHNTQGEGSGFVWRRDAAWSRGLVAGEKDDTETRG